MKSPIGQFYKLTAVNILSNIMVPLASLVDIAFLGHLSNINYLAGVSLAATLFSYLYRLLNFVRMSTTGITAQALGRDDLDEVLLIALRNGVIALLIGLSILLFQVPLREAGFLLLSFPAEFKSAGMEYFNARILGVPAVMINLVLIGWLLGQGKTGKVFLMSLLGNGTNVILDYIFIARWGWNSFGAGLASGLSQYVALLCGLILLLSEIDWQKVSAVIPQLKQSLQSNETFSLNTNIFLRTLATISVSAIFIKVSALISAVVAVENAVLLQAFFLTIFFYEGIGLATESLSGYYKGKNEPGNLLPIVRVAILTSLAVGATFAMACNLFPETIFGLLTDHTEIIAPLKIYDRWLLIILVASSIAFMLDGYFIGLSEGSIVRNVALIAASFFFFPIAVSAWYFHSNHLLWLAFSAFVISRAIMFMAQLPKTLQPEATA